MVADRAREHRAGANEKAAALFQEISGELKEEVRGIRYNEQPAKPQADLTIRRHVMGIIILLFGLAALILLISMSVPGLHGQLQR